MPDPLVSFVMPAYNAESYLAQAIGSVLAQTFHDFECIVVDDASTDASWGIIEQYAAEDCRIVPVRNATNSLICNTLNTGIARARGKYIARMDADDWSYPDRLEKQVAFMEGHRDVVICGGTMEVCDCMLNVLNRRCYNTTDAAIRAKLFRYSPFCHAATIMRRDAVEKSGGYNPRLHDAEDYDLYFRIGRHGAFHNLSDCVYKMRLNARGISHRKSRRQEWLTLYIRAKAVAEYEYRPTSADLVYNALHLGSMFLMPQSFKRWVFNRVRAITK